MCACSGVQQGEVSRQAAGNERAGSVPRRNLSLTEAAESASLLADMAAREALARKGDARVLIEHQFEEWNFVGGIFSADRRDAGADVATLRRARPGLGWRDMSRFHDRWWDRSSGGAQVIPNGYTCEHRRWEG